MNKKQQEFEKLVSPVNDALGRYGYALTGNIEATKDLIQQTLLITWENFDAIRDTKSIKFYLFKTAQQQFYKSVRRNKFKAEWDETTINLLSNGQINPEVQSDISILFESISRLPEKYRFTILLYEISGFSTREISEMEQISIDAVKKRLIRAREKLKETMQVSAYK